MFKEIEIVFFDFGGVFVPRISKSTFRLAARLTNAPAEAVKDHFYKHCAAHQVGKELLIDCWHRINKKLGLPEKKIPKVARRLVLSYKGFAKPRSTVFKIVKELKKKGVRVGLISDTCEEHADVNAKRRFYRYFDPLILSHEVKTKKPGAKIFRLAAKRAKVKPQESVFIDDYDFNIRPAKRLGFRTILFENARQLRRELKKLGVL